MRSMDTLDDQGGEFHLTGLGVRCLALFPIPAI